MKNRRFKQQVVLDYLKEDLLSADNIDYGSVIEENAGNQPVWVCWLQGEENMPPVVRACYDSILEHSNGHSVHLIIEENISRFVDIPEVAQKKRKSGLLSMTHYSDIVRFLILAKYGGLWIDSTMLLFDDVLEEFPPLYTLKQESRDSDYISNCRWSGFFIGGSAGNVLFAKISSMLELYWKRHDQLVDYFLLDYIIAAIYDTDADCRRLIDGVPYSNPDLHLLQPRLNLKYDKDEMDRLKANTSFFKLSWKGNYAQYTTDGQMTYYGRIIQPHDICSSSTV